MKGIVLGFGCVVIYLFVLAGCGGGDDSPTKAEFTNQANRVCEDGFKEVLESAREAAEEPNRPAEEAAVVDDVVPALRKMVDELDALEPPGEGGEEAEAIVAAFRTSLAKTEEDPTVAIEGTGGENPYAEPLELSSKFGLDSCAGVG